ncbi:uncharacterized protein LOC106693381 [Microplitis demolitor]|uniref:uncharacterized protein LOC106693381 n=1 Tax=Microplitis demolitor TaxID=69319 RepID=UPI0006D5079E|nr:uncharacterized protein LOC106693381 [Microplitis demolitor]
MLPLKKSSLPEEEVINAVKRGRKPGSKNKLRINSAPQPRDTIASRLRQRKATDDVNTRKQGVMGDDDVFSTDPPVAGEEIEKEKEPPVEETTAADDAEEEEAVRLMNAEYLLVEAEKSAADDSEDTPEAMDRQKFREELRRAADRFKEFLATRPETEKRFEKHPTARPEDYINLLPAPSPEVVEEVQKFLHASRLPHEYEEEVSTDSEEEDEEEEEEEEFLRENSDTGIEDDDTSVASISDTEVQVEITPATPEQVNQSTNLREKYLTIEVDPATPIWRKTLLRPVQDVYEDFEHDDPSKTFYWKGEVEGGRQQSTIIPRPSTCQTLNIEDIPAASSSMAQPKKSPVRTMSDNGTNGNNNNEPTLTSQNDSHDVTVENSDHPSVSSTSDIDQIEQPIIIQVENQEETNSAIISDNNRKEKQNPTTVAAEQLGDGNLIPPPWYPAHHPAFELADDTRSQKRSAPEISSSSDTDSNRPPKTPTKQIKFLES